MIKMLHVLYIDGLVEERRNSSALAMELRLSYTNPSTSCFCWVYSVVFSFDYSNQNAHIKPLQNFIMVDNCLKLFVYQTN